MKIKAINGYTFPENVTVSLVGRKVVVKGPRGQLKKDLSHLELDFRVDKKTRRFTVIRWFGTRPHIACINTAVSTVKNMCLGVTKGFRFKMRFAYAHFPINVSVTGQNVEIRNFLGEKRVRGVTVPKEVKVYRTDNAKVKDELVLESTDLNLVSQACAQIHEQCLVKNKDIRKFLDGIYVQTKTTMDE